MTDECKLISVIQAEGISFILHFPHYALQSVIINKYSAWVINNVVVFISTIHINWQYLCTQIYQFTYTIKCRHSKVGMSVMQICVPASNPSVASSTNLSSNVIIYIDSKKFLYILFVSKVTIEVKSTDFHFCKKEYPFVCATVQFDLIFLNSSWYKS